MPETLELRPRYVGLPWRRALPQHILALLPLTLFFPVGLMYGGVLLFYIALLASGDYRAMWLRVRTSPLLLPVLALSAASVAAALLHERGAAAEFWPAFWHYQIYLFLLPFLAVGAGDWQARALRNFFLGALLAASLFFLNLAGVLPANTLFRSYVVYAGNKSILLALLLALAGGWMLQQWVARRDHALWRAAALVYVVLALVLLARSRTAFLGFVLLCVLLLAWRWRWTRRSLAVLALAAAALLVGLVALWQAPAPPVCEVARMQPGAVHVLQQRMLCTVHQVRDFSAGRKVGDDGVRLEIYRATLGLIAEKPLAGHGIGAWIRLFPQRTEGLSASMTTPHNDYLLYWCELGLPGLLALLWLWTRQWQTAWRLRHSAPQREHALMLAMLSLLMMFGALFNAILRDALFGMAFMILLALPLAGLTGRRAPE